MTEHISMEDWPNRIPITQYIPPNGRKEETLFPVNDAEAVTHAQTFIDNGFSFACEFIRLTNEWAFYIVDDNIEQDYNVTLFEQSKDYTLNRQRVTDWIKSVKLENALDFRRAYVAQENADD